MKADEKIGVYYVHDLYGCASGCCGHKYVLEFGDGSTETIDFFFFHDREEVEWMAQEWAHKYQTVVLWDQCEYLDD